MPLRATNFFLPPLRSSDSISAARIRVRHRRSLHASSTLIKQSERGASKQKALGVVDTPRAGFVFVERCASGLRRGRTVGLQMLLLGVWPKKQARTERCRRGKTRGLRGAV